MPGYGFSDKPRERNNPERMAQIWATLMARLGYSQYIVHGSDWGIAVATYLALADSSHISGCTSRDVPGRHRSATASTRGNAPPPPCHRTSATRRSRRRSRRRWPGAERLPLGLASWIIDKWHSWSDHDGDLETVYTKDDL
jgi:pimeloyl-ACP methyl ester carboxylesterase